MIPIVVGVLGAVPRASLKDLEELEIREKNQDHTDHSIVKIGQNTQKSPGDLLSLSNFVNSNCFFKFQ